MRCPYLAATGSRDGTKYESPIARVSGVGDAGVVVSATGGKCTQDIGRAARIQSRVVTH